MRIALSVVTIAALTLVAPVPSASADETGMASIHSWRKVGKKTCFVDHDHQGSGSGLNQRLAQAAAINSWASFTAFEYGSSWANFNIAIAKKVRCEAGGSGVTCNISAIPCRPW